MSSSNRLAVLVAATSLWLSVAPATAQEVLACYTLHNDLANFDRRAHQVDHYFAPGLKAARAAAIGDSYFSRCAFNDAAGEDCTSARQRDWARYRRLQRIYDRSHLGGSDVVRLRIIDQMRYLGCPLPEDALAYDDRYGSDVPPGNSGNGRVGAARTPPVYK
jgi:hypothetical protein